MVRSFIADRETLDEIRSSWKGVRLLRERVHVGFMAGFASGSHFPHAVADVGHNLPFIHAVAVLNDALQRIAIERSLSYQGQLLGRLIDATVGELPWHDIRTIREAVHQRNDVAHRGEIIPRYDCWRFIEAIEGELVAWGVIEATAPADD